MHIDEIFEAVNFFQDPSEMEVMDDKALEDTYALMDGIHSTALL